MLGRSKEAAINSQVTISPDFQKREGFRLLLLVVVLAIIVLATTGLTILTLYSTAVKQTGDHLSEMLGVRVDHTLSILNDFAPQPLGPTNPATPSYLALLADSTSHERIFGDTGEFVLAALEDENIVVLLIEGRTMRDYPEPFPINAELARPMQRAFLGESGTSVGLDYRGTRVLAAFEAIPEWNLGVVIKVDLIEIWAPYRRAILLSLGPALIAIFLGALAFTRITRPVIRRIAEGQQRYQDLIETMTDGLAIEDEQGFLRYVNEPFCRIIGKSRDEVLGSPTSEFLAPGSKDVLARQTEQRRNGIAASYELSFIRPDGSEVATLVSPQPIIDANGGFQGSFATVSEITNLKEIERQLRAEKEQAQRYLDIAGVMLIVLDQQGLIVMMNRKGLDILGYADDSELIGKDWFTTCVSEDVRESVRAVFTRMMSGEIDNVEYFENTILTRDGQSRIIAWHNTVMTDGTGAIVGSLSSGDDMTEQRLAEQERLAMESHLRQGQKLESIGTLASGVAHEINNPLTGIINYAQLIHDRIDDPKLRDFAEGIVEEGNRVATIVKSLLSFSRQDNERHSPADMTDLIHSTLSLIGAVLRKDQIQLSVEIAPDLPLIKCRSQQIQQVLLNLLTNARDALNERYPEFDENKILRVTMDVIKREEQSWIRTVVEDHGCGIPQHITERIFDPFFSTKPHEKGTGLGLSISYGLVREHHGRLFVETKPDAYTRFIMELPIEISWSLDT